MSGVHSVPRRRGWAVHVTGAKRAAKANLTQAEADVEAIALAKRRGVLAYLHHQDGRIRKRVTRDGED